MGSSALLFFAGSCFLPPDFFVPRAALSEGGVFSNPLSFRGELMGAGATFGTAAAASGAGAAAAAGAGTAGARAAASGAGTSAAAGTAAAAAAAGTSVTAAVSGIAAAAADDDALGKNSCAFGFREVRTG